MFTIAEGIIAVMLLAVAVHVFPKKGLKWKLLALASVVVGVFLYLRLEGLVKILITLVVPLGLPLFIAWKLKAPGWFQWFLSIATIALLIGLGWHVLKVDRNMWSGFVSAITNLPAEKPASVQIFGEIQRLASTVVPTVEALLEVETTPTNRPDAGPVFATVTPFPQPQQQGGIVVRSCAVVVNANGGNANVRSAPSDEAPVLRGVASGTPLTVFGIVGNWATEGAGWIHTSLLTEQTVGCLAQLAGGAAQAVPTISVPTLVPTPTLPLANA